MFIAIPVFCAWKSMDVEGESRLAVSLPAVVSMTSIACKRNSYFQVSARWIDACAHGAAPCRCAGVLYALVPGVSSWHHLLMHTRR